MNPATQPAAEPHLPSAADTAKRKQTIASALQSMRSALKWHRRFEEGRPVSDRTLVASFHHWCEAYERLDAMRPLAAADQTSLSELLEQGEDCGLEYDSDFRSVRSAD